MRLRLTYQQRFEARSLVLARSRVCTLAVSAFEGLTHLQHTNIYLAKPGHGSNYLAKYVASFSSNRGSRVLNNRSRLFRFRYRTPRFYISLLSALESVGMKVCEQVENIFLFPGIFRFPESR